MKGKILILGGGLLQIPLIKKAKEKGYNVYLSDYFQEPPGKKYCDGARQISTFSIVENYQYALEEKINYIMTIGSDQPVYTAAKVSKLLGLAHPISDVQGRAFTNKHYMKEIMAKNKIPSPRYKTFSSFQELNLAELNFPLVLKPVDSQGQRGIAVLTGKEEKGHLEKLFKEAQSFSSTGEVIFEEFYPGDEITVNCWVKEGIAYCLLITDRLHFDDEITLGLCKQQRYPCKAAANHQEEIEKRVQELVHAFDIKDGPLYIQMIVGAEGAKFVEFGYRIGGGFESEIIPMVTGIDILELYFTLVTEGRNLFNPAEVENRYKIGAISFLFADQGIAKKIVLPEKFKEYGKLFIKEDDKLGVISNATSRIGCFTFYSNEPEEYFKVLREFEDALAVYNEKGEDILIHNIWE